MAACWLLRAEVAGCGGADVALQVSAGEAGEREEASPYAAVLSVGRGGLARAAGSFSNGVQKKDGAGRRPV